MSAASCRPRRLERNHTPNAGRVPDDDAAIRRFKGLPIFFSFIRYVRSARFAVPLSTKPVLNPCCGECALKRTCPSLCP